MRINVISALVLVSAAFAADQARPPGPWSTFILGRLETSMYKHIAAGRFRMALKDCRAALDRQRIPCESADTCRLLSAFGRHPDLEVGAVRVTTVTGERRRGHLFLPVTIGGISAHYILDTGAD